MGWKCGFGSGKWHGPNDGIGLVLMFGVKGLVDIAANIEMVSRTDFFCA